MTVGWERLEKALRLPKATGRVGFIPFLTTGYPNVATTIDLVLALESAGVQAIELGVPFSDPLADGATIQRASHHALNQGVTFRSCLEVCSKLRRLGAKLPLVLMGYYNPILSYGLQQAVLDSAASGVDGFIVADLPLEESGPLRDACEAESLALVPLLAPTSTTETISTACSTARGFIYCVSLAGVTGARLSLPEDALRLVSSVREYTDLPLAVGFGISNAAQVQAIGEYADAVVVGSALLEVIVNSPVGEEASLVTQFVGMISGQSNNVNDGGEG